MQRFTYHRILISLIICWQTGFLTFNLVSTNQFRSSYPNCEHHTVLWLSTKVLPTLHLDFYAHLTSSLDIYLRFIKRPAAPLFSLESLEHLCCSIFFPFQDALLSLDTWLRTLVLSLSRVSQPAAPHSAVVSIPYVLAPAPLWGNTVQF